MTPTSLKSYLKAGLLAALTFSACSAPQRAPLDDPRSRARVLLEAGQLDQAEQLARRLAKDGQLNDQLLLAEVWIRHGKHKQVVELLSPLFKAQPKHARIAKWLALALDATGQGERALRVYARRLRLVPDDRNAARRFASLLLQRGNPGQAAEVAAGALKSGPKDYTLLTVLAKSQLRRGRLPMARKAAAAATQLKPEQADGWLVFARVEAARGEYADAERAVVTGLKYAPQHVPSLRFYAALLAAKKDLAGAARRISSAIAVRPDDPQLLNEFAVLQFRLGHHEAATLALRRALKNAPKRLALHRNLIEVLLADARLSQAAEAANIALAVARGVKGLQKSTKQTLEDSVIRALCALTMLRFVEGRGRGAKKLGLKIDRALDGAGLHLTTSQRDAAAASVAKAVKAARRRAQKNATPPKVNP